jgi:[ribosomal protein S18]-alanine N-acetyltransferase
MDTYNINKMNKESAKKVCQWQYPPPYHIYNMDSDSYHTLLANDYYEVVSEQGVLIGYFCFGEEAHVPGGNYEEDAIDIGLGLCPTRTGKGEGEAFVTLGITFAKKKFSTNIIRLTVAEFNKRAIKVYEKIGFERCDSFINRKTGKAFYMMQYKG